MADLNANFAIRVLNTDPTIPLTIVCPITCSQIVIQNIDTVNAQKVRSDPVQLLTEKALPAGTELTLRAGVPSAWGPGSIVCAVLSAAGAGPICVTFLR